MSHRFINPESLGVARGYSNGVLVEPGGYHLFIAGQIAWDSTQQVVSDDFATQYGQALANVTAIVREAGGQPQHITRLTAFVTDRMEYLNDLKGVGEAHREQLGKHFPAMALVEVRALLDPRAKIEIEGNAVIPADAVKAAR